MSQAHKSVAATAGVMAMAVAFIAPYEGLRTHAYRDAVGVWTVCYGETLHVKPSDHYTAAQCRAMLQKRLPQYDAMVSKYIHVPLTDNRRIALISFTYNLGGGTLQHSSVARYINAGNTRAGCNAIKLYDHAGGRVFSGLTLRRKDEQKLCLEGL